MLFETAGQGRVFLWMMAAGAAIALWYGACAAIRRLLRAGFWISLAADAAWGAGAAALFLLALWAADYGRLRLYAAAGAAAGFALCAAALFEPARRVGEGLGRAACRIFVTMGRIRWIKVIFK